MNILIKLLSDYWNKWFINICGNVWEWDDFLEWNIK